LAKIIISLRDPIERTFSHYLGALRGGDVDISFTDAFKKYLQPIMKESHFYKKIVVISLYHDSVKRWLDIFSKKQVKILIFEEYIKNPRDTIKDILSFLELKSDIPENIGKVYNPYSEPIGDFGNLLVKNRTINKIAKTVFPSTTSRTLLRILLNKNNPKPEMLSAERTVLEEIFREDSRKLKKLLELDLPWFLLK